jgi:predicted RNA-binding Zn ribbon-like protein
VKVSYEVAGLVLPARIGGHPALDLCNTYAGWADPSHGAGGEYLDSYTHLVRWASDAGLVEPLTVVALTRSADRLRGRAARVLDEALAVRSSLHAVLTTRVGSRTHRSALAHLTDAARAATSRGRLAVGEGWVAATALEQPLDAAALSAARLLADVPLAEVHACPGDGCGWVFHDRSGRRRWCRMEWCGNRLKQRAHAARAGQSTPGPSRSARS